MNLERMKSSEEEDEKGAAEELLHLAGGGQDANEEEGTAKRTTVASFRRSAANRSHPRSSRQRRLRAWCKDNAPITSGTENDSRMRFSTFGAAHKAYQKDLAGEPEPPLSYSSFWSTLFSWRVKPISYDQYSCPHCYRLNHSSCTLEELAHDSHNVKLARIWPIYTEQVLKLRKNVADFILIIVDYCRIHELGSISNSEGGKTSKVSILNLTVVTNGNIEHAYDYFATGQQGEAFLRASLEDFSRFVPELAGLKPIVVWSDCGLKNYGTVSSWLDFSKKLNNRITYRFFPPYHGHSRCDAHFGRGKLRLRRRYPDGGLNKEFQVIKTFEEMSNTTVHDLGKTFATPEGNWSAWKTGNGVRSIDAIQFSMGDVYTQSVLVDKENDWHRMERPLWRQDLASLNKMRVTPYTPLHEPIDNPHEHQQSFQNTFSVDQSQIIPSLSVDSFDSRRARDFSPAALSWSSFDPSRYS